MAEVLGIYGHMVGARIRSQLQYRTSFALNLVGAFSATFLDFIGIAVIFSHVPQLRGWSLAEVAYLFGISGVAFGLTDMVIGHFDKFSEKIRSGEFDVILVRPLGSLFQVVAADFQLRRVGKVLQAGAVLVYALAAVDVMWTPAKAAMVVVSIACGSVIFAAVWVIGIAICFWTTETTEINNAFTYGGNFLTSYPIEVYGVWVRRLLAFAIPMAFVNYYPALYVLGRDDPFDGPGLLRFLSPLVALASATVAGLVWRSAIRHYRSTGS